METKPTGIRQVLLSRGAQLHLLGFELMFSVLFNRYTRRHNHCMFRLHRMPLIGFTLVSHLLDNPAKCVLNIHEISLFVT